MKKFSLKNLDGFDERQLNIINSCYKHGFWFALLVILSNFLLMRNGIYWAYPSVSLMVSWVLVFTFFAVESCFRGIGVGKRFNNNLKFISPVALFIGAVIWVCRGLHWHISYDAEFISEWGLTYTGGLMVCGLMFLLISVCNLIEILYIRKVEKKAGNDS
ncbi:MAG: hypothetical protein LBC82_05965 [Oscillospiraceae bacterium]|jgi:hypothetical protein|nr:hypothetical protein [Oscillospiraceae bacterium]